MKYIFFILGALLVSACEYNLKEENYVTITPPEATHPFSLNLTNQSDTVYIFNSTSVHYNFNSYGLNVNSVKFTMDNKSWSPYSSEGSIDISPYDFAEGYHHLSAEIFTSSGTGSIGDLSRAEGYYIKKSWTVLVQVLKAPTLTMYESISKDGHLKISWDKCNQLNFKSYVITFPDYSQHVITNRDSNFIVDNNYVCGTAIYRLTCNVLCDIGSSSTSGLTVNYDVPGILFEEKGLDSLKVYWHPPKFKCKYFLEEVYFVYTTLLNNSTDTSVTIAHPGLSNPQFNLAIRTLNGQSSYYESYTNRTYNVAKFAVFGYFSEINYEYNKAEDVLYACSYDSLVSFDNSYHRINNLSLGGTSNTKSYISCPTNSSKVGILFNGKVFIYNDKNLNNPAIVSLPSTFNYINYTNNNKIILGSYGPNSSTIDQLQILDVDTKTLSSPHYFNAYGGRIFSSKDGKYVAYVSRDSICMYEVQNNNLIRKYAYYSFGSDQTPFAFNDYNPSQYILKKYSGNKVEMRNCEDNSLVSSVDLTISPYTMETIIFYDIDPITGYLFITISGFNYAVLDMDQGVVKYKINSDLYGHAKLYKSRIYTQDLRMLNITNKL